MLLSSLGSHSRFQALRSDPPHPGRGFLANVSIRLRVQMSASPPGGFAKRFAPPASAEKSGYLKHFRNLRYPRSPIVQAPDFLQLGGQASPESQCGEQTGCEGCIARSFRHRALMIEGRTPTAPQCAAMNFWCSGKRGTGSTDYDHASNGVLLVDRHGATPKARDRMSVFGSRLVDRLCGARSLCCRTSAICRAS